MKKSFLVAILMISLFGSMKAVTPRGVVIVSTGFNDDGKGKIAFKLAKNADAVVCSQGGSGTGHHATKNGKKLNLNILPVGFLRKNVQCFLTSGLELDLFQLFSDIDLLIKEGVKVKGRLWVSSMAHIILPYHRILAVHDAKNGRRQRYSNVNSRRGMAWAAADKRLRGGIRVADLIDEKRFPAVLKDAIKYANTVIVDVYGGKPIDYEKVLKVYVEYARRLRPYVKDNVEITINKMLTTGKGVIFEGAQGTFMDVSLGAYPYVSSSSTITSGILTGALVPPNKVGWVVGVVKSYATRIGKGPFPSEIKDKKVIEQLRNPIQHTEHKSPSLVKGDKEADDTTILASSKENNHKKISTKQENMTFPTESTTNDKSKHQRYGWLDLVMLREAILINGINSMVITHLDHLDDLDEIYMCYDYVIDGVNYDYLPTVASKAKKVVPRYMKFKGWKQCTRKIKHFSDLPQNARNYLNKVSMLAGVPISYISVGEDSSEIIPHKHDLIPL